VFCGAVCAMVRAVLGARDDAARIAIPSRRALR
jgi:hypothetical protein